MYLIDTNVLSVVLPEHVLDKKISASALVYDRTIFTCNTQDFMLRGVKFHNPFTMKE